MQVNSYLTFNGQCEAAFKFYEQSLGGKIIALFTHRGTPMEEQTPEEWRDKIMHARIQIGDTEVMGSDSPPERYMPLEGISLSIGLSDVAEAERIYSVLSENGSVTMPLQQTFWAARFAMFTDQFGIPWMINCEDPGQTAPAA